MSAVDAAAAAEIDDLELLKRGLLLGQGFQLYVGTTRLAGSREAVIRDFQATAGLRVGTVRGEACKSPIESAIASAFDSVKDGPDRPVVVLTDIEREADGAASLFQRLNERRNELIARVPAAVVVLGGPLTVEVLRKVAPDLWSVRAGDFDLGPEAVPPDVQIARLPATGRDLFGREAELAWLDACWDEGIRVASIMAFGGVGKSALVNSVAAPDGATTGGAGRTRVYGWSFYSQGTDRLASSDEFVRRGAPVVRGYGAAQASPWDKGERLAALVRKERALLILDGVEPLQWGPGVEEGKLKDPALAGAGEGAGGAEYGALHHHEPDCADGYGGAGRGQGADEGLSQLSPEAGAELLKARGVKGTEEELQAAARNTRGTGSR